MEMGQTMDRQRQSNVSSGDNELEKKHNEQIFLEK